jgi:hypothetical protein
MAACVQLDAALRKKDYKKEESSSSGSSEDDSSDSESSSGSSDSESERPRKRRRKRSIVDFGLSVSLLKCKQSSMVPVPHHIFCRLIILRLNTSLQSLGPV